jgi:ornithine carbamoyltransferase
MPHMITHRRLCAPAALSAAEVLALLETAAALKQTTRRSSGWQPLRGRHLALLCADADPACALFGRAMAELGASVALLHAGTWLRTAGDELPKAARVLGKLYDAVDCCGVAPPIVEQIDRHAGVPVFDGLALAEHPTRLLADLLTMREAALRPLERLQVRLRGDARSPLYREAEALMPLAGIAVRSVASPTTVGADEALVEAASDDEADFVLDTAAPSARGRLVVPSAGAVEQERIDRLLLDNQRAVQQAIVVSALG